MYVTKWSEEDAASLRLEEPRVHGRAAAGTLLGQLKTQNETLQRNSGMAAKKLPGMGPSREVFRIDITLVATRIFVYLEDQFRYFNWKIVTMSCLSLMRQTWLW
ncbi:uncharacterized protein CLUP02_13151 [Colletotrichum lupini]|uniref:Uncharacterized protein n=1 Tax=Colletotrichum lupini TaxID=145971 RepID=A0A9Q8T2D5_9PEZI|nr:uncharacterized protein CLUP02_13151 [Colletotrichum lupini]UQC87633.1 hypothetical protein CLUP02_13151 [Colletotrichum lupini]